MKVSHIVERFEFCVIGKQMGSGLDMDVCVCVYECVCVCFTYHNNDFLRHEFVVKIV